MTATIEFIQALRALKKIQDETGVTVGLLRIIASQFALESNYGNSLLAVKYGNLSGLKWRKELNKLNNVKLICWPSKYTDWESETDAYVEIDTAEHFPRVYLSFISRPVYGSWDLVCLGFNNQPARFITHLANSGFCGSIETVNRGADEYAARVHLGYLASIFKIYNSATMDAIMQEVHE